MSRRPQVRHRSRAARPAVRVSPGDTAADLDLLVGDLLAAADTSLGFEGPLQVERGTSILLEPSQTRPLMRAVIAGSVIPALVTRATPGALALALGIAHLAPDQATAAAATRAVDDLRKAGVPDPAWAAALAAPLRVLKCWELTQQSTRVVIASFGWGELKTAIAVPCDEEACGEATAISMLHPADVPGLMAAAPRTTRRVIAPMEFRWHAESALAIRADHDAEDDQPREDLFFSAGTIVLRHRLNLLPEPLRPRRRHHEPLPDPDAPL